MSIADEIYMSNENSETTESKTAKKSNRYNCDHNDVGVSNLRLYKEVKASLIRTKNSMIDEILSSELDLDENLQLVAEVVNSYERMRLIYQHYIFEGDIPIELLPDDADEDEEELTDDDIAERDFMEDDNENEDKESRYTRIQHMASK